LARRSSLRTYLSRVGVTIVQGNAAVKTGNLQQNAIQSLDKSRGVLIFVNDTVAPYGYYLDTGFIHHKTDKIIDVHQGWFSDKSYNALVAFTNADLNDRKTTLNSTKEMVNENTPTSLARQNTYLRNIRKK